MELIGVYLAACLLLVGAGLAKAWRPADTARALTTLVAVPQRAARRAVRAGAGAEAALGLAALVAPRPLPAGAVAASYVGFALFVAYARRRGGPLSSCGCFGSPDTPPTRLHVVVDLGLAAAAACVAVSAAAGGATVGAGLGARGSTPPVFVTGVLAAQPWRGVPLLMASVVCAWLTFHALSTLPRTQAQARAQASGAVTGHRRP